MDVGMIENGPVGVGVSNGVNRNQCVVANTYRTVVSLIGGDVNVDSHGFDGAGIAWGAEGNGAGISTADAIERGEKWNESGSIDFVPLHLAIGLKGTIEIDVGGSVEVSF